MQVLCTNIEKSGLIYETHGKKLHFKWWVVGFNFFQNEWAELVYHRTVIALLLSLLFVYMLTKIETNVELKNF